MLLSNSHDNLRSLFINGTISLYWWAYGDSEKLSDLPKDTPYRRVKVRFFNLILSGFKSVAFPLPQATFWAKRGAYLEREFLGTELCSGNLWKAHAGMRSSGLTDPYPQCRPYQSGHCTQWKLDFHGDYSGHTTFQKLDVQEFLSIRPLFSE